MTDNTEQRAAIERAVEEAMQEAWTEICSDTNCCPLDITRHRGKTYFEPRHWSALTAKWVADAILAAQPAPLGEACRIELQDAQIAMTMIVGAETLSDARSIAASFLEGRS